MDFKAWRDIDFLLGTARHGIVWVLARRGIPWVFFRCCMAWREFWHAVSFFWNVIDIYRHGMALHGVAWILVWHGMAWHDADFRIAWHGVDFLDMVWRGIDFLGMA